MHLALFYLFLLACSQVTTVEGGWASWGETGDWLCNIFGNDFCPRKKGPSPDITPPTFTYCPDNINVRQERNRRGAYVEWVEPEAEDDRTENVRVICNTRGEGFFSAGETVTIRYTAFDDAGNKAHCVFQVSVQEAACSRLTVENGFLNCGNDGHMYGATCTLTCFPGYILRGERSTTCQQDETWSPTLGLCQR